MLFRNVPEPEAAKNKIRLVLVTDHYDEETERLTGLGARRVNENKLPKVRWTTFADPEGNEFDLAAWQPE